MSTGKNKRYKGKTCVYCGVPKISNTGDHVLAREFVLERHRARLPKVPACNPCNEKKSRLEHHLTSVMPFAARHADAAENLVTMVPKRLAKNLPLRRSIEHTIAQRWLRDPSGLLVKTSTVHIEASALDMWVEMVVKGLVWHHWKVVTGTSHTVEVMRLHENGAVFLKHGFAMRGERIAETIIGGGALSYEAQGVSDGLPTSIWRLSIYGGIEMAGEDPRVRTKETYVVIRSKDRVVPTD